jgi:hypothetical protein
MCDRILGLSGSGRQTEKGCEDLCCFISFSGQAEPLCEGLRGRLHSARAFLEKRGRLDAGLGRAFLEFVEQGHCVNFEVERGKEKRVMRLRHK